jgi:hypothetical protein
VWKKSALLPFSKTDELEQETANPSDSEVADGPFSVATSNWHQDLLELQVVAVFVRR